MKSPVELAITRLFVQPQTTGERGPVKVPQADLGQPVILAQLTPERARAGAVGYADTQRADPGHDGALAGATSRLSGEILAAMLSPPEPMIVAGSEIRTDARG